MKTSPFGGPGGSRMHELFTAENGFTQGSQGSKDAMVFCHQGAKSQSFTNRFHTRLARERSRDDCISTMFHRNISFLARYDSYVVSFLRNVWWGLATNSRIFLPRRMVSRKARKGVKTQWFFAKVQRHKDSQSRKFWLLTTHRFPPLGDWGGMHSPQHQPHLIIHFWKCKYLFSEVL